MTNGKRPKSGFTPHRGRLGESSVKKGDAFYFDSRRRQTSLGDSFVSRFLALF